MEHVARMERSAIRGAIRLGFEAAGSRPGGDSLFFASSKKIKQKKNDPAVCDLPLRSRQPALGRFCGGVARTRCAQTIAPPDPVKPTQRRRIQKGWASGHPTATSRVRWVSDAAWT